MSETEDRLSWLAFRYVANELDATETREFESRLITDQVAREAVATAVEETIRIRRALAGAVVVTAASQRSKWSRRSTRVAVVAIGSCLTLLLAVCLVRPTVPVTGVVARPSVANERSDSPAQLAYAWAEARYQLAEFQPATNVVLTDAMDPVAIVLRDLESEQSLVAPSWMIAALAKMGSGGESEIEIQE
ncbi:MAG: hypothetical protein HYV60_16015 [Planctomycetia bacterium]|nr:hypothetical protein [Planctomycetia bacterium]